MISKKELIKLLDEHTKCQERANEIEALILNLIEEYGVESELPNSLGCLCVSEPRAYKSQVLEDFKGLYK